MATFRADIQAEERQNCPICLCDFKIPRQLPCMHSFCEKCLQDYLSSQEAPIKKLEQIKCPICRQDVRILQQGKSVPNLASQFPINVILQSILSDSKVKVDQPCDACHSAGISTQAQNICVVCEEAMCKTCSAVHRNQKVSKNHVIISVEEFTSNPHNVMKFAKGFSCIEHDGEVIDFYCKDHKTACCSKCCIVSHRNCANVSDLKMELPSLLQEINPDSVIEQMKQIETHLTKFTETNDSNISLLESQVNDLTSQIRDLRKKMNDVLDELERKVKTEGHRIYKEEIIRKQEENHRCQSLINSIRNSHTLLETVKKYGTGAQVFFMTEKMTSQLTSYLDQIQEKYTKMETTTILLEVNPKVKSMMLNNVDSWAKLASRMNLQSLSVPCTKKPSTCCLVQLDKIIEIQDKEELLPNYNGITYLCSGHLVLVDHANRRVCLLDSSYNSITSYNLPSYPYNVCIVDVDEVAVTLPSKNLVQFMSVRNGKFRPTKKITTTYTCTGLADAGNGKVIISGDCNDGGKYYWSIISSGGKEEFCHLFDCQCSSSWTSVTLDSSFRYVYITVNLANSVFCFDLNGSQKFVYSHDSLKMPRGVATDRDNNVFVIGWGSNNIHQITPDGDVLQIISEGSLVKPQAVCFGRIISNMVPTSPEDICFNRVSDVFLVTNLSDRRKLYEYRLKY